MKFKKIASQIVTPVITALILLAGNASAQQPQKPADDVIRVSTDLVQSAFTVVDKDGHFVEGLRQDQLELTVDGKPRPISFFERVTAGSQREYEVLAKTGAAVPPAVPKTSAPSEAAYRGRTVVFFIDDLHLEPDSMHRTRDMLRQFIDKEMVAGDSVAITSASGQVGFLQQFTRNKEVLKAAVERLSPIPYDVRSHGTGTAKMSEYMALDIDTHKSDDKVMKAFVLDCMKQTSMAKNSLALALLKATCETEVKENARAVLMQSGSITRSMYESFASLLKSTARMPGRKLAFFVSDGFLMDSGMHGPELRDRLERVIDSAQRAGVVVYTIHAKGLATNFPDASVRGIPDERLDIAKAGEVQAYQDALHALAEDTGGRALRGMNYFDRWVSKMLDETSNYYVIAWRPESDQEKAARFRQVKVRVIGRPELVARAPRGYVDGPSSAAIAATAKAPANHALNPAEAQVRDALADYFPSADLPIVLSLTYLNTPKNEMLLNSSMEVSTNALNYGKDGKEPATVRIAGVILNDKGKITGSFKNQLNVTPINDLSDTAGVIYNDHTPLPPGIYQVRAVARDEKSGRLGSANQWIAIPDLAKRQLTTSSILLGGTVIENKTNQSSQVQFSVDHRFTPTMKLAYWIFIYNAARSTGAPRLTVQLEVLRNGQVVSTGRARKIVEAGTDPDRIAFGDELALNSLAFGKYELHVIVKDEISGTTVTQQTDFEIH